VNLVDKEDPPLFRTLARGAALDSVHPNGIKVIPEPIVEMTGVPLFPDQYIVPVKGTYRVDGLALQYLIVSDDLRPDLVVKQVHQGDFVIVNEQAHELFKEEGLNVVDLKAIVPQKISVLIESDNDGMCIAVTVENLVASYIWVAVERPWIKESPV